MLILGFASIFNPLAASCSLLPGRRAVHDANQQRVTRLGGEEEADSHQRGWSAADDRVLRRIAHEGMDQLASFLVAPPDRVPAPPALPAPPAPAGAATTVMAATAPTGHTVALAAAR